MCIYDSDTDKTNYYEKKTNAYLDQKNCFCYYSEKNLNSSDLNWNVTMNYEKTNYANLNYDDLVAYFRSLLFPIKFIQSNNKNFTYASAHSNPLRHSPSPAENDC